MLYTLRFTFSKKETPAHITVDIPGIIDTNDIESIALVKNSMELQDNNKFYLGHKYVNDVVIPEVAGNLIETIKELERKNGYLNSLNELFN